MADALLVGADPEVFLYKEDKPIPVVGLLGGTKEEPRRVKCGAVQEDNVLAEININPAATEEEFLHNINTVMKEMGDILHDYELVAVPSTHFNFRDLMAGGEQALTFGCDPDRCAWTGRANISPESDTTLRTAGGHIHLGHSSLDLSHDDHIIHSHVKMMDFMLGIPSVLMDEDNKRRNMYGKAGAYRRKRYGLEYRTLSNFWLNSGELIRWVYSNSVLAFDMVTELPSYLKEFPSEIVQGIINQGDKAGAEEIVNRLSIPVV